MLKVLVVEASSEGRARMVDALCELRGVEVAGAAALPAAVAAIAAAHPDAVVAGGEFGAGELEALLTATRSPRLSHVVVVDPRTPEARRHHWLAAGASHVMLEAELPELGPTLQRLARRDALVGKLAADATHELERHLARTDDALAALERGAMRRQRPELRAARQGLGSIGRVTTRLAAVARAGAAQVELVELPRALRAAIIEHRRTIPDGIEVIVEAATELGSEASAGASAGASPGTSPQAPLVRYSAGELAQLVLTLVLEASERMPWGGTIWLIVEREGVRSVRLEVLETGSGAPLEPGARSRWGDALEVVRGALERHGGSMRFGRHAGGGPTTTIRWPAA